MDDEIPRTSLVPGLKYTIHSDLEEDDSGYDADAPYTGVFVSRRGIRTTFRDVKNKSGRDEGLMEFGQEHYYVQDAFRKGRELTGVTRLSVDRNLPPDVQDTISSFLSGETGTTGSQMDAMQQKLGKSLARRPSGRPSGQPKKGGRTRRRRLRKTRRRHK